MKITLFPKSLKWELLFALEFKQKLLFALALKIKITLCPRVQDENYSLP